MGDALPALLRRYGLAGWRYRWLALSLAWLVCLAGWTGVFLLPNKFESSARLYVDSDAVLTPLLRGLTIDSTPANQVELLQRTLLSRPNVEKLIAKTDLDNRATTAAEHEELVRDTTLAVKIVPQTKNLFTITYRDTNPRLAYSVVRTIIDIFMESAVGSNRADMASAQKFVSDQIASYEAQLRQAEQHRAEFLSRNLDLLRGANGTSNLETMRSTVTNLQLQLQDSQSREKLLGDELAKTQPLLVAETLSGGTGGGGRSDAVVKAERDLADLRTRYTDRNPDVIDAVRRLAAARAVASGNGPGAAPVNRSIANPVYEQLKVRAVDAQATSDSLARRLADATKERDRLEALARREPEVQAESANIDRDYNVLRHNYEELLARREAMRIARAASTDADKMKMDIVDPPVVPRTPVSPPRSLLLLAVLGVGLASGAGLVVLLVQMNTSFATLGDLRALGLPVLGALSRTVAPRRAAVLRQAAGFGLATVLLLMVFGGLMLRPLLMQVV